MASFVILGSIRSNLSQEIMNNQTVSEAGAGGQLRLVYSARGDADAASPVLIIVYLSFLLTAVILSIVSNNRARRREQEIADTVAVRRRGSGSLDKPPSYTNIFFNEEPPQYHEIVCYESGGSTPVPRSDLIIL